MSENTNYQKNQLFIEEAKRHVKSAKKLTLGHYITSSIYGQIHFFLGTFNAVIAAVTASGSVFQKFTNKEIIISLLSITVAILTALITFLNPDERKRFHLDAATEFESISTKLERFVNVTFEIEKPNEDIEKLLDELLDKYRKARKSYPLPGWSWWFVTEERMKKNWESYSG
ncbi:SLATT domain-containing protein [Nostoc sp. FACHB-888]|uniref:SLATT domain-containing protein n=1 Tax=Nostoc sp. FACHB-888 TaxID=2692842 RepID=UPI001681E4EE|nr:SLATT domain-containing protein [Nostoc sp. FACHB-888]MBD2248229.1 SLATT domain-containing protein [Nostoc sp. FACHB-888]